MLIVLNIEKNFLREKGIVVCTVLSFSSSVVCSVCVVPQMC